MSKEYIIVGSDNFWYALCPSLKDAKDNLKDIRKNISGYANPETGKGQESLPETFYIYEAKLVKEVDN